MIVKRGTPLILLLLTGMTAAAQENITPSLNCDDSRRESESRQRVCEMREFKQAAVGRIVADGRTNGGISVHGWQQSSVLIRAKVQAWAPAEAEARTIANQISIQTAGGNIRADAPEFGRERGWAVSYEIFVPNRTDLSLKAHNGGISISDVQGRIEFEGMNGGISLKRLAGTVRGKTVNGGLTVELTGTRWDGDELNVSATNGGVTLRVPENYSARLEAGTVNGGFTVDYPISVQGRIGRELAVNLGSGGALVRARTTNGGVSIRRAS